MKSKLKYTLIPLGGGMCVIQALRDIPRHNVLTGDLGGYVADSRNLSQEGDCWVAGTARVRDSARVSGNAIVCEQARVFGSAKILDNARVGGTTWVCDMAQVGGQVEVTGSSIVQGTIILLGQGSYDGGLYDEPWVIGDRLSLLLYGRR